MSLAACGGSGHGGVRSDPRTLTATIGFPEPHTIFAPGGGGGGPGFSGSKVLERLVRYNADQSFSPVLATQWAFAPDHKSVTVDLREGVKWHDQRDFTAEDVAFSIKDYWKPFYSDSILDFLAGVDVVNPHQVIIRFSVPVPEFSVLRIFSGVEDNGAAYILPKHIYAGKEILTNPANNAPIGTGPWKFGKWVRGSYAEFVKNPTYWQQGQPKLDKLIIRWWREPASRAAAFETGELDIGVSNPIPLGDIKRFQSNTNLNVVFEAQGTPIGLHFNTKRPIYSDKRVRQALLQAIDRDFIVKTVYYGLATPGVGPILTTNTLFFTSDIPRYTFDAAKAGQLLDAAGYPVRADGKRFTMSLLASGWSEENAKVGAYLKQAFGDLKIDVTLRVPDRPNSLKALYTDYDFDVAYSQGGGSAGEPLPELAQLFTSAGITKGLIFRNASRYSTLEMDSLVERIKLEVDEGKRRALVQQFARLAITEAPVFTLIEWPMHTITQKTVHLPQDAYRPSAESWGDVWKDP